MLIKKKIAVNKIKLKKIGPVVLFSKKKYKQIGSKIKLPEYHINYSKFLEKEKFIKSYLLPIHFMMSDSKFGKLLSSIKTR